VSTNSKRYNVEYPHGIMFHHFKDEIHPDGQGAITSQEFEDIIEYIGPERIVNADEWKKRYLDGTLDPDSLCITFDDALKCQYDVAKPVLDKYGIKAFFFVYSSPLMGNVEPLEVYRYFRSTKFDHINDFYNSFLLQVKEGDFSSLVENALVDFVPEDYLKQFSFYTTEDRTFRYIRDIVLGPEKYHIVMNEMLEKESLDNDSLLKLLWMNESEIKSLNESGHIIGLHSFTHPTVIKDLSKDDQVFQYSKNKEHLESLLGFKACTMSHPCNSYSKVTLGLLEEMKIELGFRANMMPGFNSKFEVPREDHINVLKMIQGNK